MTAKGLLNQPDNTATQGPCVSMVLSNTKHTKQSRHWEQHYPVGEVPAKPLRLAEPLCVTQTQHLDLLLQAITAAPHSKGLAGLSTSSTHPQPRNSLTAVPHPLLHLQRGEPGAAGEPTPGGCYTPPSSQAVRAGSPHSSAQGASGSDPAILSSTAIIYRSQTGSHSPQPPQQHALMLGYGETPQTNEA